MTVDKAASHAPASEEDHGVQRDALFWIGTAAVYGAIAFLYWRTLAYAPLSLDDQSQLGEVAGLRFVELWDRDHFGHFRPLKRLLFWLVASANSTSSWRACLLLLFATTSAVAQTFATRVSASRWIGLGAVTCWALHPTTASVVCWLSAANSMLALLATLVYLLLNDLSCAPQISTRRQRALRAAASVTLAAGVLSHEFVLLSPMLLLCLEQMRRPGPPDRRLYSGSLIALAAYAAACLSAGSADSASYRFESATPRWLMTAGAARYLGTNALLWILPSERFGVLLRDDPEAHLALSCACWVGFLLAGYGLWACRHRDRVITYALVWSAISLSAFSNFVPFGNTPVAVHYLLLPGIGLALAIARVTLLVADKAGKTTRNVVLLALFGLLGCDLAGESSLVIAAWGDEEELYNATLANYPGNVEAMVNLAALYLAANRGQDAASLLAEARRLSPGDLNALRNTLAMYARANQPQAALDLIASTPTLVERSEFLIREAEALQQLKRFPEARSAFERAFDLADPVLESAEWCAAGYGLAITQLQTSASIEQAKALVERLNGNCTTPELTQLRELLR